MTTSPALVSKEIATEIETAVLDPIIEQMWRESIGADYSSFTFLSGANRRYAELSNGKVFNHLGTASSAIELLDQRTRAFLKSFN